MDLIKLLMNREAPMIPKMHFGVIDVRDIAEGNVKAISSSIPAGKRYFFSNTVHSMADFSEWLDEEFRS